MEAGDTIVEDGLPLEAKGPTPPRARRSAAAMRSVNFIIASV